MKKPVKTTNVFEAQLAILDHKNIICAGYTAVLHIHTGIEEITLSVSDILVIVFFLCVKSFPELMWTMLGPSSLDR